MKQAEFREEVVRYLDRAFAESSDYRKVILDIYNEFRRICKDAEIKYYIAYGTLLGAVRDRCIIPWDYDFDVQLPVIYKDVLIEELERNLGEDYYFVCSEKTDNYPFSLLRVCRKGYDSYQFHVDVFYLVGSPDDEKKRDKFCRRIRRVFKERVYKYRDLSDVRKESRLMYAFKQIQNHLYGICPKWLLDFRLNRIINQCDYDTSKTYVVISEEADQYPAELFSETHEVEVEGSIFVIPDRADGDYLKYPPIESRFDEYYEGHKRQTEALKE